MIVINGTEEAAAGKTLHAYLEEHHFNQFRIAVECNGEIIPKSQYGEYVLTDGDVLEIVSFVGGG